MHENAYSRLRTFLRVARPVLIEAFNDLDALANALRDIATAIGCPADVDPITDLDGLVLMVRGLAERAESLAVVTADRDALRAEMARFRDVLIEHGIRPKRFFPPYADRATIDMLYLMVDKVGGVQDLMAERDRLAERVAMVESQADGISAAAGVALAERDAEHDARIAEVLAVERYAMARWVQSLAGPLTRNGIANGIEHGYHIDGDAPPLPSLRMVMLARDEALRRVEALTGFVWSVAKATSVAPTFDPCDNLVWLAERVQNTVSDATRAIQDAHERDRLIERLTAERDRRIDPVEHARAVREAYRIGFESAPMDYSRASPGERDWANMWRCEYVRDDLAERVGADVLAEVER